VSTFRVKTGDDKEHQFVFAVRHRPKRTLDFGDGSDERFERIAGGDPVVYLGLANPSDRELVLDFLEQFFV